MLRVQDLGVRTQSSALPPLTINADSEASLESFGGGHNGKLEWIEDALILEVHDWGRQASRLRNTPWNCYRSDALAEIMAYPLNHKRRDILRWGHISFRCFTIRSEGSFDSSLRRLSLFGGGGDWVETVRPMSRALNWYALAELKRISGIHCIM